MTDPLSIVQQRVRTDNIELADHAYDRMVERLIDVEDAIQGVLSGKLIDDYREIRDENRILVLQKETGVGPLHTVWDLPLGENDPVILVSAYRPNPAEWNQDFTRRRA